MSLSQFGQGEYGDGLPWRIHAPYRWNWPNEKPVCAHAVVVATDTIEGQVRYELSEGAILAYNAGGYNRVVLCVACVRDALAKALP